MKKAKTETLLSMKAYAKKRGVSYEIIRRHCKQGRLTRDKDGKINPLIADKELQENLAINGNAKLVGKTKEPAPEVNHTLEFNKAKARREKSKADLAELEYDERANKVHSNDICAREAESLYRRYRDQMLNVVIRASKKLLGETDEFKFRKILKKEIESAIKKVD